MAIAVIVLSVLLAVAFAGAGVTKLAGAAAQRESAAHIGFSFGSYRVIGALEIAGALGLLVGFAITPLGLAAAIGLALMMVGAVYFHVRARDPLAQTSPAAVLGVLAAATALLHALS